MKRFLTMVVAALMLLTTMNTALAIGVLPMDEDEWVREENSTEPIRLPEPNAVLIGSEREKLVENDELEDTGTVWISWNGRAYAKYGCTTAKINYTNPGRSNIGVTLKIAIFDGDMLEYFGTTFRTENELLALALNGLDALQNGITLSSADYLVNSENPVFGNLSATEVTKLNQEELSIHLSSAEFIPGLMKEDYLNLSPEKVEVMTELEKLTLAQLGGYNFYTFYMDLTQETGVINPSYALYQIDLYTLTGGVALPKGKYKATFVLNGYDASRNMMSDFFIHLPIELIIEEDLPEKMQEEYGISLASRIDA